MATDKDERVVSCGNCFFFDGGAEDMNGVDHGECHKHAPVVVSSYHTDPSTWWPLVTDRDFCGDFRHEDDGI